jgi:hypothetical protein
VSPGLQRRLLTAGAVVCAAAMFGLFGAGAWFQDRKHSRSGVPDNHWAAHEGDRYYYVHRGGGPVEQRTQYPITAEQYRAWEEDEQMGNRLMTLAVPCLLLAVLLGVAADRVRRRDGS